MFNQSGRLVKKKKTTVQYNNKDPVYNETLNFEVNYVCKSRTYPFSNQSTKLIFPFIGL